MWEGAIPMWLWGAAGERVCVIWQLVFTTAFLCISGATRQSLNTVHKQEEKNSTCFMRPLEHLDEGAAQFSFSYFHQVTKRLRCSRIIPKSQLHHLLCKAPRPLWNRWKQTNSDWEERRSQIVTSPRSEHLQRPYRYRRVPHLLNGDCQGNVIGLVELDQEQVKWYSAYSCRCSYVAPCSFGETWLDYK